VLAELTLLENGKEIEKFGMYFGAKMGGARKSRKNQ
jgi:hypothetical protein